MRSSVVVRPGTELYAGGTPPPLSASPPPGRLFFAIKFCSGLVGWVGRLGRIGVAVGSCVEFLLCVECIALPPPQRGEQGLAGVFGECLRFTVQ